MDGRRMGWRRWAALVAAGSVLLSGCRAPAPPALPRVADPPAPHVPAEGSGNAFDAYVRAAALAESADPRGVRRVHFTPDQRAAALQRAADAAGQVARATARPSTYVHTPAPPFADRLHVGGWRLIGRVIVWRIEDAGRAEAYDRAIDQWAVATRFGLDLAAGDAVAASLGWTIVDDARRAIVPLLPRMGAAQLNRLAGAALSALERRPDPALAFRHEHANMLQAVQALQDAAARDGWDAFLRNLGPDAEGAIRHLRNLARNEPAELPAYFAALRAEADAERDEAIRRAGLPALGRGEWPAPPEGNRPWRRFARAFFTAGRPLQGIVDRSLARTRLLAAHARALASVKSARRAPPTLPLTGDAAIDPFSGEPFRYQAERADFRIYSVGADLRDDGGETDAPGVAPDLVLEVGDQI